MSKHIATRDIKFGSLDGDRWVKAGDEIPADQLNQFPAGTFRTIDENTFPGGKCPTCGQMIATTYGQAGVPAQPVNNPPSTQRDAPTGDAARDAALASMRNRPDNAESGLPSFGKIPIDVENSFVQGRATQQVRRDATTGAGVPLTPPAGAGAGARPPLSDEQRRTAAEQAPKPKANEPNMGGFGSGGETQPTASGTPNAADQQQPPQQQPPNGNTDTTSVPSGRRGSAAKP